MNFAWLKKNKLWISVLLAALGIVFCWAGGRQKISEGIFYEYLNSFRGEPLSIHIVEVDPSKVKILPEFGQESRFGLANVSSMAERKDAIVAINAGFFHLDDKLIGVPAGIFKINNNWLSDSSKYRGVIGWSQDLSKFVVDRLMIGTKIKFGENEFDVNRINQNRSKRRAIIYTPEFGLSTRTSDDGLEFVVVNGWVVKILVNRGNSVIPKNGYIFSVDSRSKLNLSQVKVGDRAELLFSFDCSRSISINSNSDAWQACDYLVGGTPVLISDGTVVKDFSQEKDCDAFIFKKHPRTAVGILPNRHWMFVVVDGYQQNISDGMTIPELADFMHALGCESALNMDGGSSSVLFVKDKVANVPAKKFGVLVIKGEKPVSDSIVVLPKQ